MNSFKNYKAREARIGWILFTSKNKKYLRLLKKLITYLLMD
nr:MAG TPA: hypothetical protein [Caudoviricetes sp.]